MSLLDILNKPLEKRQKLEDKLEENEPQEKSSENDEMGESDIKEYYFEPVINLI